MNNKDIINTLDAMIPNPICELEYKKDYELLIATVLSAQSTDKRVNQVTKKLFGIYDLKLLATADIADIERIIKPVGTYHRKAEYIKGIAQSLLKDCDGCVPNNRTYLESLPGVGRKTCNVVLSEIYNIPCFAVDTHVNRVSKRLGIAMSSDAVEEVEAKLMNYFPKDKWNRLHHQLVLFGRYTCKAKNPECSNCKFKNCQYKKNEK